jgi:hypothetical protein
MENAASKAVEPLADPLVVYRDLKPVQRHVNGKPTTYAHQVYARPISEFTSTVSHNNNVVKRFIQI